MLSPHIYYYWYSPPEQSWSLPLCPWAAPGVSLSYAPGFELHTFCQFGETSLQTLSSLLPLDWCSSWTVDNICDWAQLIFGWGRLWMLGCLEAVVLTLIWHVRYGVGLTFLSVPSGYLFDFIWPQSWDPELTLGKALVSPAPSLGCLRWSFRPSYPHQLAALQGPLSPLLSVPQC